MNNGALEALPARLFTEFFDPELDEEYTKKYSGENYSPLYAKAYRKYQTKHGVTLEQAYNRLGALYRANLNPLSFYAVALDLSWQDLDANNALTKFSQEGYRAEAVALVYLNGDKLDWPLLASDLYLVNDFSSKEIEKFDNSTRAGLRTYYDAIRYGTKEALVKEYLSPEWATEGKKLLLEEVKNGHPRKIYELANVDIPLAAWKDLRDAPVEWLREIARPVTLGDNDDYNDGF